jgi:hypothetical protein
MSDRSQHQAGAGTLTAADSGHLIETVLADVSIVRTRIANEGKADLLYPD